MNAATMREWVKTGSFGKRWSDKVDKMTDNQVMAIYYYMVKQGKIKGA